MGTRGASVVSGPELAARLGLGSTWAYFSVLSGSTLRAEPDHSGQPRQGGPESAAPGPPATGSSGGVAPVPGAPAGASAKASGGTPAGR